MRLGLYYSTDHHGSIASLGRIECGSITNGGFARTGTLLGIVLRVASGKFDHDLELPVASQDENCIHGPGRVGDGRNGQLAHSSVVIISTMGQPHSTYDPTWSVASRGQHQRMRFFVRIKLSLTATRMCAS